MEIKTRYDTNRVGAIILEPIKTERKDVEYVKCSAFDTRYGRDLGATRIISDIDSRVFVGKLLAQKEYTDLFYKDEKDFVLKIQITSPNLKGEVFVTAHENGLYLVYNKTFSRSFVAVVKEWILKRFHDIKPSSFSCRFHTDDEHYAIEETDEGLYVTNYEDGGRYLEKRPYVKWKWDG